MNDMEINIRIYIVFIFILFSMLSVGCASTPEKRTYITDRDFSKRVVHPAMIVMNAVRQYFEKNGHIPKDKESLILSAGPEAKTLPDASRLSVRDDENNTVIDLGLSAPATNEENNPVEIEVIMSSDINDTSTLMLSIAPLSKFCVQSAGEHGQQNSNYSFKSEVTELGIAALAIMLSKNGPRHSMSSSGTAFGHQHISSGDTLICFGTKPFKMTIKLDANNRKKTHVTAKS